MANILLFSEASSKFGLPLTLSNEYTIYITNVELMRIAEIIGKDFYDDIVSKPQNYTTLLPIIKEAIQYWAYDMYLRQATTKNSVGGPVIMQNQYMTVDKHEKDYKINSNLEVATFYERKLWEHLEDNIDDYPLYTTTKDKNVMPKFSINVGDRSNVDY
jgi:hypothetical protein